MTRAEIARFADALALVLADGEVGMTEAERLRNEGALTALEIVLGRSPSLVESGVAAEIRAIL